MGFPGFPRRAGEGGFQTRPYGSRERGEEGTPHQVPVRRGQRADTWVRPYARRSGGGTLTPVSSTGQAPGRASLAVNAGLVCGQNFAEAAGDDLLFAVAEVDGDDGDAALGPSGAQ